MVVSTSTLSPSGVDLDVAARLTGQIRLFEAVASTTPDFIYVFDRDGRFQYANRRLLEVWGMRLQDVIGKTCLELGYQAWHHDMHMREIAQVIATKRPITGEVPFEASRTGIFGVYEYIFTPVLGPDGEVELIAGTTRDVSERKRVEEALRASEERLAIALRAGQLGFWDWDVPSGGVVFGGRWAEMLGYLPEEIEPNLSAWDRLIHPDDKARVEEILAEHLEGRSEFYECEHRLRHKDGSWRWILDRGCVVERDADGRPLRALGTHIDMTARKQAEETVGKSSELLKTVIESSPDLIWAKDSTGRITLGNQATFEFLGGGDSLRVLGRGPGEVFADPERAARVAESDARVMRSGEAELIEEEYRTNDARVVFQTVKAPLRDSAGNVVGLVGVSRDVTASKRIAARLDFLGELGALLAPLSSAAEIAASAATRIGGHFGVTCLSFCHVNEATDEVVVFHEWRSAPVRTACATHRLSDFLGTDVLHALKAGQVVAVNDVWSDPRIAARAQAYAKCALGAVALAPHIREGRLMLLVLGSQSMRQWNRDELALIADVAARVHICLDRARAEDKLAESESFYRQTLESIPGMTFTNTPDGSCDFVSGQWEQFTGIPAAQQLGEGWVRVLHPDDVERAVTAWRLAVEGRGIYDLEYRVRRHDGAYEWFKVRGHAIHDARGRVARWFGTAVNVDNLKRAEEALRAREARYRELFEHNPHAMWVYDAETFRFLSVNDATLHLYGYSREEFAGLTTMDIRPAEEIPRMFEVQRQVIAGYQVLGEWRHRKKDGSIFHVETRTHPLMWEGRRAVLAMANDITARKLTEEAMRDSDRQKDEFLAMLAHELRNPLAPIRASTAILRSRAAADPMLQRCRDIIERQTGHMARLLDDLLDVSRLSCGKLTLQRSPVLLREALDAAIETSRPLIERQSQQLMIEAGAAAVVLDADSARLTQVFANLLNNAARYSHPGGRIELRVHPGESSVTVSVRDEGIGIEAPMLDRVFDLFAQGADAREHAGGGLGIGLSLARRLVEMHGGAISARSAGPGQGSTFLVSLPVLVSANEETSGDAARTDGLVPGCRILIADDNVDAADTMAMLFEGMQCKVRAVYTGAAAAREAEHFQPDVVLLDLGMPDVDGYEACRRIRAAGSGEGMLIVAISGWGRDADLQKSTAAGFDHHLLKPVDPDALIRLIRDAQRVSS